MKSRIQLFGLPLVAVLIAACGSSVSSSASTSNSEDINYDFSIISPTGAPTAAFYEYASSDNFSTNSTATYVAAQFATTNYDVIVFDSLKGINQVTNATDPAAYKLARVITKGNFFLAGIDKTADSVPTSDDLIVSFGQNGTPDTIFKQLYPELSANIIYLTSVSDALACLVSGIYDQQAVDYVFISQPALFNAMNNKSAATYGRVTVVADIQQKWYEKTGMAGFPQAGVFVRNDVYSVHPKAFANFLAAMDDAIETGISDPNTIVSAMNEYGTASEQAARFGYSSVMFAGVQEANANGFGLTAGGIDVNAYYSYLGLSAVPSTVFLDIYA